jgi:hypothetical protein
MSIAFAGFFSGMEISDGAEDYALGLLALAMLTLVLVAVIGLPSAWLATERLGRAKGGALRIDEAQRQEAIAAEPTA